MFFKVYIKFEFFFVTVVAAGYRETLLCMSVGFISDVSRLSVIDMFCVMVKHDPATGRLWLQEIFIPLNEMTQTVRLWK